MEKFLAQMGEAFGPMLFVLGVVCLIAWIMRKVHGR
jgi:hypothetical protein